MKKLAMLLVAAITSMAAMATTYTGVLNVSVNGEGASQGTSINIDSNEDGTYTLSLNNFVLQAGDETLGVGNIVLPNVPAEQVNGFNQLAVNQNVTITAGDLEGIDMWMGPFLGEVPLNMVAQFNDAALGVVIDIDMTSTLGQVIKVQFTGSAPAAPQGPAGDVNGDGAIDSSDVTSVVNIIVGK